MPIQPSGGEPHGNKKHGREPDEALRSLEEYQLNPEAREQAARELDAALAKAAAPPPPGAKR